MKLKATFLVILFLALFFGSFSYAGDKSETQIKISENSIKSLLLGLTSDNLGLKTNAAYLLGEFRISEAVVPLMRVLRNDNSEEARIAAALALYKINTPLSINAVKQSVRFDESARVSKLAANFYNNYLLNKQIRNDGKEKDSTNVAVR